MIEVKRQFAADLFPIGSMTINGPNIAQKNYTWIVYDIYENHETRTFVEIWIILK